MNIKLILLCIPALLLSLIFQSSAYGYVQESQTYYHDRLFDKTFNLTPSPDEIVVVFENNVDYDDFQNQFQLEEAQRLDREKRIGVYKVPAGMVPGSIIDQLTASPFVRKAAPAYIDQEGFTKYCVPTELTVQFNHSVAEARMMEIIREVGSEVVRNQWTPGYFTISAPDNKGYFEIIRLLYTYEETRFSEPSIISYNDEAWTPDDTHFGSQWALSNTGQVSSCSGCSPYGDHDIDAVNGWDISRGDPDVVVVIIDTGMDLTHPDLAGNLLPRNGADWDFADDEDSYEGRSPDDEHKHGTACSGIAAAIADNDEGVAGVANLCRIMPLRVNLTTGYNQNRADAINYATTRRPDFDGLVLSNSWRMSSGDYTAVHDAIVDAYSSDVLVCFAAGNSNGSVSYPALYPEAMAIAATSPCDERKSPSSCDGENWWGSNYGPELDCAAPGVIIYTTDRQGSAGYDPGDYFDSFNGTSAACPHVAGVAAAAWATNTDLTNIQLRNIINQTADQVGGYYYDPGTGKSNELGHGRVNLYHAICSAWGGLLSGPVYDEYGGPLRPECTIYNVAGSEDAYVPDGEILTVYAGNVIRFSSGKKITAIGDLNSYGADPDFTVFQEHALPNRIRLRMLNCHLYLQNGGAIKLY